MMRRVITNTVQQTTIKRVAKLMHRTDCDQTITMFHDRSRGALTVAARNTMGATARARVAAYSIQSTPVIAATIATSSSSSSLLLRDSASVFTPIRVVAFGSDPALTLFWLRLSLCLHNGGLVDLSKISFEEIGARDPNVLINSTAQLRSRLIAFTTPNSKQPNPLFFEFLAYRHHEHLVRALLWNGESVPQSAIITVNAGEDLEPHWKEIIRIAPQSWRFILVIHGADSLKSREDGVDEFESRIRAIDPRLSTKSGTPCFRFRGLVQKDGPYPEEAEEPHRETIESLLDACTNHIGSAPQPMPKSFLLAIETITPRVPSEDVSTITGFSQDTSFWIHQGLSPVSRPKPGDKVEVINGIGQTQQAELVAVHEPATDSTPDQPLRAGPRYVVKGSLATSFSPSNYLVRASTLDASLATTSFANVFEAELYMMIPGANQEGGQYSPLLSGEQVLCSLGITPCSVEILTPTRAILPGGHARVRITLQQNAFILPGLRFTLGSPTNIGQFIALGNITRIISKLDTNEATCVLDTTNGPSFMERLHARWFAYQEFLIPAYTSPKVGAHLDDIPQSTRREQARKKLARDSVVCMVVGFGGYYAYKQLY